MILKVVGKKERGYLTPNDINKFSCEDLQIINQLWLKFSGDHFGFSVQKEIYESLGGTREYNQEVWEKFGDHVGWRKGDKWVNYSDLTFNLELASPAQLPGFVVVGERGDGGRGLPLAWGGISSLVQRLVNCEGNYEL